MNYPKWLIMSFFAVSLIACGENDSLTCVENISGTPPQLEVVTPAPGFIIGSALDMGVAPLPENVNVTGYARLAQSAACGANITVNASAATVAVATNEECSVDDGWTCFRYSTNLKLNKGKHDIRVQVIDTAGLDDSLTVTGSVDYCRIGGHDAGVLAEIQDDPMYPQGNRCHEVDGCSVYITESDPLATSDSRNDPMAGIGNGEAVASTAFGSGTLPISEFFVHGQKPRDALPCNLHDVCYQSAASDKATCDSDMWASMKDVCAAAYPVDPCTDNPLSLKCVNWESQYAACYSFAGTYYQGVNVGGASTFDQRKIDYAP